MDLQLLHVGSKSFQELVEIYLRPAMQAIARGVHRAVLGRVHEFLGTPTIRVVDLNTWSTSNNKNIVLGASHSTDSRRSPSRLIVIRRFKTGQRIGASKPAGTVESSSELLRLASGSGLDGRVLPL
ncbi:MAG TPA: hypothetical protein VHY91_02670 [Pirellulales bacterium]|nr:hypothetical protein [Pirellulales bacterium]